MVKRHNIAEGQPSTKAVFHEDLQGGCSLRNLPSLTGRSVVITGQLHLHQGQQSASITVTILQCNKFVNCQGSAGPCWHMHLLMLANCLNAAVILGLLYTDFCVCRNGQDSISMPSCID